MKKRKIIKWFLVISLLISMASAPAIAAERVITVGGGHASRLLSEFAMTNIGLGKVFYVDYTNGDDARNGLTAKTSVKTLTEAISLATANEGDIIYLLPGHAETISSAAGININKAGLTIIGLGDGALRPTFSFGTSTASTLTITAANTVFKNFIVKPTADSIVSPIVVSASGCNLDFEAQDASASIEFVSDILTTAAADNLTLKLKHVGFTTGDAGVNPIKLIGVNGAEINVDFYGKASTAVVNFVTTACTDILVTGQFYNESAALTKNVVDTEGSGTWYVYGYDGKGGSAFSGGSASAVAYDDAGSITTDTTAILADTSAMDTAAEMQALMPYVPQCIAKTDGAVLNGDDALFTISGGPVRAKIVGFCSTIIGGAANGKLTITTDSPAGTTDLNAAAVAIDNDAAGTGYYNFGATSVFTPITAGAEIIDTTTDDEAEFVLPPGTVNFNSSAAQTGTIKWYMTFKPMSPDSVVAAAP